MSLRSEMTRTECREPFAPANASSGQTNIAAAPAAPELPENLVSVSTSGRDWNGVRVDVTAYHCAGRILHPLHQGQEALLSAVLEEVGGRVEPRLYRNQPCPVPYTPRHMHFAPGGLETWGYTDDVRFVKDAGLFFDFGTLAERFGTDFNRDAISTPRLRFSDDRIWTLTRLLADAVASADPSAQLYGDGLITAIVSLMFTRRAEPRRQTQRTLAPWQLRRVVEYMNTYLPDRIELAQLAALVGLSQAHFSRAFKASTGMAPYHWQLDARIRRAQVMLLETRASLGQVAESTGFADAVHFGRTFRKLTGATPAAWRNANDAADVGEPSDECADAGSD